MLYTYLILVIVAIVLILLIICWVFATSIIKPFRQKIDKTPKDYGMEYEDVEFVTRDGIKIKAWLIKGVSDKIIIQSHPMPFCRTGFNIKYQFPFKLFNINVDLLKTTQELNKAGYWVLTLDLRNCGQSGDAITGVGLSEWQDIAAALDYIAKNKSLNTKKIGFAGFCMGANSTIIALSKLSNKINNVKCAMLIQPISMLVFLKAFIKKQFTVFGLVMMPIVELFARLRGGYPFKEMSPIAYAKDVKIPVLHIQGKYDKWTTQEDTKNIFNNFSGPKELYWIEKPMPRFEVYNLVGQDPQIMLEFFKKYL
ncbi:MAG: dienelactone hydrolase family protein [Patescibacteria group bacterium]|nr:dienelactone hydrolase family protein [Patescibacteria group bacterium]